MLYIGFKGNWKLPRRWATFNLPSGKTCPHATPECKRTCYARKAEVRYSNVVPFARTTNMITAKHGRFIEQVCGILDKRRRLPPVFRIHESGDFFSKAYFRQWIVIARRYPNIQFYAFTKRFDLFRFKRPDNFRLIASLYYDDPRRAPKGAPVFRTVRVGETAPGMKCLGNCDNCGVCPFIGDDIQLWAEVH